MRLLKRYARDCRDDCNNARKHEDCLLSGCLRERIRRLLRNGAEHTALRREENRGTDHRCRRAERERSVVAKEQRNGSGHGRNCGADVCNDVNVREGAVSSRVALLIELCGQRVHGLARDHAVAEQKAGRNCVADDAGARNRKDHIGNRRYYIHDAQGLPDTEDTVRHVGTDHAADDHERKVERQELCRLGLIEAETDRRFLVEIVDQDCRKTVVGKGVTQIP